jgi:hypothetical protein
VSCLLAVMHGVPEFGHALLRELGAPKSPTTLSASSSESPVLVDKRKLRKTKLWHFPWRPDISDADRG